jgi:hypothetical protein
MNEWNERLLWVRIDSAEFITIERSNTRYEVLYSLAILWKYRPYLYYGGPKFEKPTRAESKECA